MMQRLDLVVLFTLAVIAATYAETTCETHRRNARTSAHGVSWDIKCDANGFYEPLQCMDQPEKDKWCGCYDKEKQVSGPSKKLRFCGCPLARSEATESRASPCDVPTCARNGKYEAKQCCSTTGMCKCVNPDTGVKTTEPSNNPNLSCPTS